MACLLCGSESLPRHLFDVVESQEMRRHWDGMRPLPVLSVCATCINRAQEKTERAKSQRKD